MPATSSMIRTVPGGNVGPDRSGEPDGRLLTAGELPPPARAATKPRTTRTTRTRTPIPIIRPLRSRRGREANVSGAEAAVSGSGGASTGDRWTVTPGPAGVVTSD